MLPVRGQSKRKLGFKESVSWLWPFSKRCYIGNTGRSTKGKAVNAPTEGDESLEIVLFGLRSSYSLANSQ